MRKRKQNKIVYILTLSWLFTLPVLFYKYCISPLLPNVCIYTPSCSNYMLDAIRRRGPIGVPMGIWRILRCNPWAKGGFDPVKTGKRKYRGLY